MSLSIGGMRRIFLISMVLLFHIPFSYSQKNDDGNVLLKRANEVLYSDPEQALKISDHLLHNVTDSKQTMQARLLLTKTHLMIGNYSEAISNIQAALKELKSIDDSDVRFDTFLLAAEIYSYLELFEISNQYRSKAKKLAVGNSIFQKKLDVFEFPDKKSEAVLQKISSKETLAFSFITKGMPQQRIANQLLQKSQLDSAFVYFQKSRENASGTYWKMTESLDFSNYFFQKKNYSQAITLLYESLEKCKKIKNNHFLMLINDKLSSCYLALNDKTRFREYKQKASIAANEDETRTTLARNYAFEVLQNDVEEQVKATQTAQQNWYWILGIIGFSLLIGWLFLRWLFGTRIKHESDIISYLKLIKKSENIDTTKQSYGIVEKTIAKNLSIPKETEDLLLAKLEKFEAGKKYLSKDISLAQMASQFETNTKYLSEVINKYKQKNINLYINELRINYIVTKLKDDPKYLHYKVSYLAEECGFSSHSSFSSVFKNITGITPNVFIQFLSRDVEQMHKTKMTEA
ncbi:helix-turn-helix domain-containing protein [Flavobacterium sp.]|uniref:helix-turn-helix domain-containing protein n=1 Tax=Flavobacterium sp. TaxID=239 RepID=UPI00286AEAE4|nr:helix-turn-helix domain-containing protein [Flavobacterium sp.]